MKSSNRYGQHPSFMTLRIEIQSLVQNMRLERERKRDTVRQMFLLIIIVGVNDT